MMFPKPTKRKKKSGHISNPKPTENDICIICNKPYAHLHEVYFGNGLSRLSKIYKMQCRLCYKHHNDPSSDMAVHFRNNPLGKRLDDRLKEEYQRKFIEMYPELDFYTIFGHNYLEE